MAGNRTLKLSILADVDNLKKSLNSGAEDVQTFGDKITNFGKIAGAAFVAAAAAAGAFAVKIGIDAVKAASDLSETISKVNVLFGTASGDIQKFADGAASALGQTKQQALDAAATFATFGKAAGLSGQDLSKFSIDFVKLSSDLASFNNTSPEQAINAIGSALRGEAEPLRQYGVLLDDASMRQKALELGIIDSINNALTPQQKVLAAQALIFEQTGTAQGDFARTSDGLANQTRILTAELENAKTTIGAALLPIVLELATFIGDKFIPVIQDLSADISENLTPVFSKFFDTVKTVATPILEGLKKVFNSIKESLTENKDEFAALLPIFKDIVNFVKKFLAPVFGETLKVAFGILAAGIKPLVSAFANVAEYIGNAYSGLKNFIDLVKKNPLVKGISGAISSIFGGGKAAGGPVSGGTTYLVGEKGPELFTPGSSGSIIPNNRLGGGGSTINITVNGALDAEGTARQIVDILNRATGRGGSGSGALVYP